MSLGKPSFTKLTPGEAEAVAEEGSIRKWIAGEGQTVTWAKCYAVRLYSKDGDQWVGVEDLDGSMRGLLPRGWALQFSEGKVTEI